MYETAIHILISALGGLFFVFFLRWVMQQADRQREREENARVDQYFQSFLVREVHDQGNVRVELADSHWPPVIRLDPYFLSHAWPRYVHIEPDTITFALDNAHAVYRLADDGVTIRGFLMSCTHPDEGKPHE
jgi:hypothetical protein